MSAETAAVARLTRLFARRSAHFSDAGQPPLTRWGHAWRMIVAAVFGALLAWFSFAAMPRPMSSWMLTLTRVDMFVLGPLAVLLLAFHRRRPLLVALVVNALTAVSAASGAAALICLVSIAARRRVRELVPVALLSAAAGTFYSVVLPTDTVTPWLLQLAVTALMTALAVAFGMFIGARRELVHSLRLRAESAEREQALRVGQAQAEERARIAREMHDVLAHRISLLSMHAGVLAFRDDLPPEQVRVEAKVIQTTAQEALAELRSVLGVLRSTPGGADAALQRPQPTLADLDVLVEEARSVGQVELVRNLADTPPTWLGRQAYRIVQESLTNARKHAPGAPVVVLIAGRAGDELLVEVRNEATGPNPPLTPPLTGAGVGLIGLAERAAAVGGTLHHGARAGGYVVRAELPWAAR